MTQLASLVATTELDAVNGMLAAIGQAPLDDDADLDDLVLTNTDVQLAVNLLKQFHRALCKQPWKFNTEFGYQIAPADTYDWEGTDGTTAELNIFLPPAGLLAFRVSNAPTQQGTRLPDLTLKKARSYTVTEGTPPDDVEVSPQVFYDREKNRDGLDSTVHEYLYIDPVWMIDFEDMPETVRAYIAIQAARAMILQAVGSTSLYRESQVDELKALRAVTEDQGQEDRYNLMNNAMFANTLLRGRSYVAGVYDDRASPGPSS